MAINLTQVAGLVHVFKMPRKIIGQVSIHGQACVNTGGGEITDGKVLLLQ
jgi:hypothetical protein